MLSLLSRGLYFGAPIAALFAVSTAFTHNADPSSLPLSTHRLLVTYDETPGIMLPRDLPDVSLIELHTTVPSVLLHPAACLERLQSDLLLSTALRLQATLI